MSQRRTGPRPNAPRRAGSNFPWMWVGTALVVVVVIGFIFLASRQSAVQAESVECNRTEQMGYHVHANLKIYINGENVPVTPNTGVRSDCMFWLHTHDSSGTIHVEGPRAMNFTLGQFLKIWDKTLSPTELMGYKVEGEKQIKVYVDGQEYTGDPAQVPLKSRTVVTLEYGPPFPPPRPFQFQPNE